MYKRHVIDDLNSYLDNELKGVDKLEVEKHLSECKVCSEELSKLRLISEKLKILSLPKLNSNFDNSLKTEIVRLELKKEAEMKKKTLFILIPSGAIVSILLVVLFAGNFKPQTQSQMKLAKLSTADNISYMKYGEYGRDGGRRDYFMASQSQESQGRSMQSRVLPSKKDGSPLSAMFTTTTISSTAPQTGSGQLIVIQPALPATSEGEMVIRNADINLEVEDSKDTYKKAILICQELGGYVSDSKLSEDDEIKESGRITMRIPKDKFEVALEKFSNLGKVEKINTQSQDVTQQYNNLKTRLDVEMVVYNKMLEALQKRQTTPSDAVGMESSLTPVLSRIERLKNEIEFLNNAVSFTTLILNFHDSEVSGKILRESSRLIKKQILNLMINTVKFFVNAIPIMVVVLLIGIAMFLVFLMVKSIVIRILKRG